MVHLDQLEQRFPGQTLAIRRRMKSDAAFKELCMDHQSAVEALAYWMSPQQQSETRAEDYRVLLAEIEKEIEAALKG